MPWSLAIAVKLFSFAHSPPTSAFGVASGGMASIFEIVNSCSVLFSHASVTITLNVLPSSPASTSGVQEIE